LISEFSYAQISADLTISLNGRFWIRYKNTYDENPTIGVWLSEECLAIASEHGGANSSWTAKPEDRDKLWRARHDVAYADKALREGGQLWGTDVCVPISRLAECITETQKDLATS
jgi:FAD/FMN-containing dehydrogenase